MQSQSQNRQFLTCETTRMKIEGASISEEDVSVILQRYSATTILTVLHEVAQVQDIKIDWNALVKQTKTGITNPREYQMLWRHLAYCDPLLEKLEKNAEPVDDDSDLECELEAFPTVSNEASAEAAACVKVLMASSSPSESCIEKGLIIEAPLTINIPRTKSNQHPLEIPQFASSASGVNISIPVFVPTQVLPTVSSCGERLDNANNNFQPKKKRKPWSATEDRELFAAVQRYGEGNWANIVKGDFKGHRTASQLSQRWNIVKKRQNHPIMKTGSQLSDIQLAARQALNMALDKPGVDIPKAVSSPGRTGPGSISVQPTIADPLSSTALPKIYDSSPTGMKRPFPRPQPFLTRPVVSGPDAVKAAAVAAGARIASPSAAAAILKQQLKSAIHIKTTRPPPAPGVHMSPDYFRAPCSRLSPNAPRANLGSSNANAKVRPVVQLNQRSTLNTGQDMNVSSEVKPSTSANSPEMEPIQEDQVAVSSDQVADTSNQVAELGSKDQDQVEEEKRPDTNNTLNTNLESEGRDNDNPGTTFDLF